jgi:chromosome partitioning protein
MYIEENRVELPCPTHIAIERSDKETRTESQAEERWRLSAAINELRETHDYIIIDTPGSDHFITRLGHSYADILITPINDSFIDLDLLAEVDMNDLSIGSPNSYAEMVFDQRKQKALRDGGRIDWFVMRNRLSHLDARNKQDVDTALTKMADRLGFKIAPGFGERVIYRELYLKGLTLMDLKRVDEFAIQLSHISARQEVRSLLNMIGIAAPRNRNDGSTKNKPEQTDQEYKDHTPNAKFENQ